MPTTLLTNGVRNGGTLSIPLCGLGTWKSNVGEVGAAVKAALRAGLRHIDCAACYGNEKEVGEALREAMDAGIVKREELFVTSKLWNTFHAKENVGPALAKTLADLKLDFVDLYLMHWPHGFNYEGPDVLFPRNADMTIRYSDTHYNETWQAMEELCDQGLCHAIGVSNFNTAQIDDIIAHASKYRPAVNQVECHAYLQQEAMLEHAQKAGYVVTAYSPLGSPDRPWAKPDDPSLLSDPAIGAIADKYAKSAAQILLRFLVQRGIVVIPKSVREERIRANSDLFDFVLDDDDMRTMLSFERSHRFNIPTIVRDGVSIARDAEHPLYPFERS